QPVPCTVAVMADNGLNDHTYHRCGQPEPRQLFDLGAVVSEYTTCVAVLQGKSQLDAHEPEAHVPYLPEGHGRFFRNCRAHVGSGLSRSCGGELGYKQVK